MDELKEKKVGFFKKIVFPLHGDFHEECMVSEAYCKCFNVMCSVLLFYHLQDMPNSSLISGAWHDARPRWHSNRHRGMNGEFVTCVVPSLPVRLFVESVLFDFKEFKIQVESNVEPKQLCTQVSAKLCGFV